MSLSHRSSSLVFCAFSLTTACAGGDGTPSQPSSSGGSGGASGASGPTGAAGSSGIGSAAGGAAVGSGGSGGSSAPSGVAGNVVAGNGVGGNGVGGGSSGGTGSGGASAGSGGSVGGSGGAATDGGRDPLIDASIDAPLLPPPPPGGWCPATSEDGSLGRPAFTAPPSGCGTETPGRRMVARGPRRPTCPATNVTETAVAPNCPDANPNDNLPDDDALQTCLNRGGLTALPAGTPGFILAKGLAIFNNGTILRGADPAAPARFVAAATLHATMILADSLHDIVVRYLDLDGNRPARTAFLPDCHGYPIFATGLA